MNRRSTEVHHGHPPKEARPSVSVHRPTRLSVIIPTRNEQHHVGPALAGVCRRPGIETIVVDGQSRDQTVQVARSYGATVIESTPCRASQMNLGAQEASGDVLLFLHADTQLPAGFDRLVDETLSRKGVVAGAFRLRIQAPGLAMRWIEGAANLRSRLLSLPYGDQALFLRAETFRNFGGFADIAGMEDFELVRRLRPFGRVALARGSVQTSARRWLRHGVFRTTLLHQAMIGAFLVGISARRIVAWRD